MTATLGSRPRVAVLIPVYNRPDQLLRSLRSLFDVEQGIPFDVLVVDDGSEPAIDPDEYSSACVKILRLSCNQGIVRALNHGLEYLAARDYDYVARLDAGDTCEPYRMSKQVQFLEEHSDYAMIGGQALAVDTTGRVLYTWTAPVDVASVRIRMHVNNVFIHPAVMMRQNVLQQAGFYSDSYPAAEDYELFFRLLEHHPCANLEDIVVRFEITPSGLTQTRKKRQVATRIKVQVRHFDPLCTASYWGLIRSLIEWSVPLKVVRTWRSFFPRRPGTQPHSAPNPDRTEGHPSSAGR